LQLGFVIAEKRKIIDVPKIRRASQRFLYEAIQRTQVIVGKILTRQVSDRQAFAALQWHEQIVTWEVINYFNLFVAVIDDGIDQPQYERITDTFSKEVFQNLMIDGREYFLMSHFNTNWYRCR